MLPFIFGGTKSVLQRRNIIQLQNFGEIFLSFIAAINGYTPVIVIRPYNIHHELNPLTTLEVAILERINLAVFGNFARSAVQYITVAHTKMELVFSI